MTQRLVGSARIAGMVQLHQALPLVERQHALIEELALNAPNYTSAARLAERTGVSTRTVERDIDRLAAANIPIHRQRGRHGGYRLHMTNAPRPTTFTRSELAALIASLVALGPYSSASAATALDKLIHASHASHA